LSFSVPGQETKEEERIVFSLTHEEIGESIGTTRETVTRTLTEFRKQHFAELRGCHLTIQNRPGLEGAADGIRCPNSD
jgi:CRP/FNR family cyclic AMP-dependent transcriptional regulator